MRAWRISRPETKPLPRSPLSLSPSPPERGERAGVRGSQFQFAMSAEHLRVAVRPTARSTPSPSDRGERRQDVMPSYRAVSGDERGCRHPPGFTSAEITPSRPALSPVPGARGKKLRDVAGTPLDSGRCLRSSALDFSEPVRRISSPCPSASDRAGQSSPRPRVSLQDRFELFFSRGRRIDGLWIGGVGEKSSPASRRVEEAPWSDQDLRSNQI